MKLYLKENIQFIIIVSLWIIVGFTFSPLNFFLVPFSILIFHNKGYEEELFIGFLLVLTFSDSRIGGFQWAGQIKNIYILILALITFKKYLGLKTKVKLHLFILPFVLIAAYCIIYSPVFSIAIQKTMSYFLLFFIVPNIFSYLYENYNTSILRNIVWAVAILLAVGILMKYINPHFANLSGRYRGVLGNPNGLGIFSFLFICFFTIVVEFFPNLFRRNDKILIYFISFLSLLFCGARSSLIGVTLFLFFRYFNKLSPILSFMILILTIASYEYISNNIESIVFALGLEEYFRLETLKDGSGRLVAWLFALENIEKNFFIGKGFAFTEKLYFDNAAQLSVLGHQGAAHNAYLTFWLDTGLIGLTAILSGLVAFIIKISKMSKSVFPLLYAVLFSNQFESWLTASLNPFTILFLLSLSMIFVVSKERILSDKSDDTTNSVELEVSHA